MNFNILISITVILTSLSLSPLAKAEPLFNGDNVCNSTITVKKDKRIEEPVSYKIPYNTICDIVRVCVEYRTETRINSKKITVWEDKIIPTCCPGYAEHSDRTCKPICTEGCRNGKCVGPNKCKCDIQPTDSRPGYTGNTCSRFVCFDENKWGTNCQQDCKCSPNAYCHATTGKCICRTNWRGPNCTEPCQSDKDSGCDEFTLLQVSDPEVNMIPTDDVYPRSSALQLEAAQPSTGGNQSETTNAIQLALTQTAMNIILVFITFTLIFTLVRYRQRLNRITNELYYSATSTSSDTSSNSGGSGSYAVPGSIYSEPDSRYSIAAAMQKRPLVPTPLETDASQLSKNLSFASVTRNIVKGITSISDSPTTRQQQQQQPKDSGLRNKCILDPLVEVRLARSGNKSTSNVYCQPDLSFAQKIHLSNDLETNKSNNLSKPLSIDPVDSRIICDDSLLPEGHYQVPKSPNIVLSNQQTDISNHSHLNDSSEEQSTIEVKTKNSSNHDHQYTLDFGDSDRNNSCNIYEEIKPRSPSPQRKF